jgi:hypothetical protein
MRRLGAVGVVACALFGAGCAPALSSFTPAHVAPKHHVQGELGFDVSVPTGSITDVIQLGKTLNNAAHDRELTDEEQRKLFRAGAGLALNPPSLVPHVGAAYTLVDHFEVGGRLTPGAWRLGARYQLLEQALQGLDGSVGLGGGHYSYEFPISDQIPLLSLEDFSRWQIDVACLVGKHGDWYRVWGGPRLLFSFYGTELTFDQPSIPGMSLEHKVLASLDGTGTYVGGQLGGALGYKHVFLGFELTMAKFWTNASLTIQGQKTETKLQSFIVYPGVALMLEL